MKVIAALWGMARPLIMLSVILVYGAGGLIARAVEYQPNIRVFGWGLVALLFVALSIHYVNEYADFQTDALTRRTPFSGGSGVLPSGDVPRILALQAGWVTLIFGIIIAIMGIVIGLFTINALLLLLVGAFGGWMYSLPPLKLAWCCGGEVTNALLGGMLLPLYGYTVQTGRIDGWVIVACLPFTLMAFINLLATTWADREADAQAGKHTLATRLPIVSLRLIYSIAALLCFILLILLSDQTFPQSVAMGSFVTLPLVIWGWLRYTRIHSPHPTVFAMIAFLLTQMLLWLRVGC